MMMCERREDELNDLNYVIRPKSTKSHDYDE